MDSQAGRIAFAALAAILLSGAARAQVTTIVTDGDQAVYSGTKGPVGSNPVKVGVHYSIDPATGALGIELTFPLPGGSRGPHVPLVLQYTSSFEHPRFDGYRPQAPHYEYEWRDDTDAPGGWRVVEPSLDISDADYQGMIADGMSQVEADCLETGPYIFTSPGGGAEDLGLVHLEPNGPAGTDPGVLCPDQERDSSGSLYDGLLSSTLSWGQSITVAAGDGTRYIFNGPTYGDRTLLLPSVIEDANGNEETIVRSGNTETWTDSSGRAAAVSPTKPWMGRPSPPASCCRTPPATRRPTPSPGLPARLSAMA